MNQFILFGQFPFSRYAHIRLASIAKSIESMSDVEVLMYKDSFETLTKKLVNAYSLLPVDISFDDKIVDLLSKSDPNGNRCFVEYTLMVKGDPDLLKCDPFSLGYVSLTLPVIVKTNVISFEIDTAQYSEDLSAEAMTVVKRDYDTIKEFIVSSLLALNNESQKFNLQLEEFIIPILARKMRAASNYSTLKDKLNFK
jgi:hypothetical protein